VDLAGEATQVLLDRLQHEAASLNVATVVRSRAVLPPRTTPSTGRVPEQRLACERLGLRTREPARRGRRAAGDDRRLLEQALGRESRPRTDALAHGRVEAFADEVDGVHRGVDLERERRMLLAPAAEARQQPSVR
jgi:hypothetical protein